MLQTITSAPVVHHLDNGLTIALERLPYLRSVAAGIWIKAGSGNETAEEAGISHFLEHLFFKGTTTRTPLQIVEAIEHRGGQINAFTSRDYTCLYVKVLDTHIQSAIEILSDMLKNSQFFDLEKERNVILEEIASADDVPEDCAHDQFVSRSWPAHPLGRPVAGYEETVSKLSLENIRGYFDRWYKPDNIVISVAGNFDEAEMMEQLVSEFDELPHGTTTADSAPPVFTPGTTYVDRDITQSHLCFGFTGPEATSPDRFAYDVLSSVLGGGSSSRLFQRVREEEGLAYSIYSYLSTHRLTGMLGFYAAVAPENLERAIECCTHELKDVRDVTLSDDELEANREQIKGGLLIAMENTFNRMARLAKSLMFYHRIISVEDIIAGIDNVGQRDIQRISSAVFSPKQCSTLVLGPATASRMEWLPL